MAHFHLQLNMVHFMQNIPLMQTWKGEKKKPWSRGDRGLRASKNKIGRTELCLGDHRVMASASGVSSAGVRRGFFSCDRGFSKDQRGESRCFGRELLRVFSFLSFVFMSFTEKLTFRASASLSFFKGGGFIFLFFFEGSVFSLPFLFRSTPASSLFLK